MRFEGETRPVESILQTVQRIEEVPLPLSSLGGVGLGVYIGVRDIGFYRV